MVSLHPYSHTTDSEDIPRSFVLQCFASRKMIQRREEVNRIPVEPIFV
jgi:hypothetical protein